MTIEFSLEAAREAAKEAKRGMQGYVTTNNPEDEGLSRMIIRQKLFNMYYSSVFEAMIPEVKKSDTAMHNGNHTLAQEIVSPYISHELSNLSKRLKRRRDSHVYKGSTSQVQKQLDLISASFLRVDQRSSNAAAKSGSLTKDELYEKSFGNRLQRTRIEQTTNSTPVDINGYPIHWQLEFRLLDIESSEIGGDKRRISSDIKKGVQLCTGIIYSIGKIPANKQSEQNQLILKRAMSTITELTLSFGLKNPDPESVRLATDRAGAYFQKYNDPALLVKTNFEWIKVSSNYKTLRKAVSSIASALLRNPKETTKSIFSYLR